MKVWWAVRKEKGHMLLSIRIDVLYDVSTLGSNSGATVGTFLKKFCTFKTVSRIYE